MINKFSTLRGVQTLRISMDNTPMMPWKNGGGVSHEIYKSLQLNLATPPFSEPQEIDNVNDDWLWRISFAKVDREGPFSIYPNRSRFLALTSGEDLTLRIGLLQRNLETIGDHVFFEGEDSVLAIPLTGPTTDFNLMWQRDKVTATLLPITVSHNVPHRPSPLLRTPISRKEASTAFSAPPHKRIFGNIVLPPQSVAIIVPLGEACTIADEFLTNGNVLLVHNARGQALEVRVKSEGAVIALALTSCQSN